MELKKLTIAIDWDSTLSQTVQIFLKMFHEKYPHLPIPVMSDLKWDLWEPLGITKEEVYDLFQELRDGNHHKYASPCDVNFWIWIKMMQADGHELVIITRNPPEMEEMIKHWLNNYGVELPIIFVDHMKDKFIHQWDVLIDDAPAIHEEFISTGQWEIQRHLMVYHQPWNAHLTTGTERQAYRVYNWRDVFDNINYLSQNWERINEHN